MPANPRFDEERIHPLSVLDSVVISEGALYECQQPFRDIVDLIPFTSVDFAKDLVTDVWYLTPIIRVGRTKKDTAYNSANLTKTQTAFVRALDNSIT